MAYSPSRLRFVALFSSAFLIISVKAFAVDKDLASLFSPEAVQEKWKPIHSDLSASPAGALRVTFWKGYESTGFETLRLPVADWSAAKSLKFDVENPYPEPFSVYVRISSNPAHPADETYTGGTFDGYVLGPGRNTVEISLERMQSPEERPVDSRRIAYLGIFFNPLFLRDGMALKFAEDKTFDLSNLRLEPSLAKLQKQPYADPLFQNTAERLRAKRHQAENQLAELQALITRAQLRGIDTSYAEIYPFLADVAFHKRLVAFWQDRAAEQNQALDVLFVGSRDAAKELSEILDGRRPARAVPPLPDYAGLAARDGYFRLGDEPQLLFGMLYNRQGPLLRWFANSQTDYGTELVAGATRHDVERQPIWQAYHQYPDTHRVGWTNADHIIRDRGSWEVVGEPVNVCLESPHSREAVAQMIEKFERAHTGDRRHLVQNMGFEYTYVCYCDFTRDLWHGWLARKYAGIADANARWGTAFTDFAAVPMPRPENAAANRALWFDGSSFNLDRFLQQIRWTRDQIRRWEPSKPLTVGSPYFAFSPAFWTGVDEEELADSGITGVVLEENYELDTLMPEYLHSLAGAKPVMDFEYHGVIPQILPSFLHGDAAISMWWWNDDKHWTPNEPINEWASSFPQSYTLGLDEIAKSLRDALDLRRLNREIVALATAPRPIVLLYSKTSMLQQLPEESAEMDTFPYLSSLRRIYNASQPAGVYVGLTTEKRILAGDLDRRKALVLPGAEFVPEIVVKRILDWVEGGGTLVVSPDSLLADEYARPNSTLAALGLRLVRREPPALQREEHVVTEYNLGGLPRWPLLKEGRDAYTARGIPLEAAGGRQILECDPAVIAARFPDGVPALLRIPRGRGVIYWLATPLAPQSWSRFLSLAAEESGLKPALEVTDSEGRPVPSLEYRVTPYGKGYLSYFYNNSDREMKLLLQPQFTASILLDRRNETVLRSRQLVLPARETAIVEFQ